MYLYEDFGPEMLGAVLRHYPHEAAASLLPRVRAWYLLLAADWAARRLAAGPEAELAGAVEDLRRELVEPAI